MRDKIVLILLGITVILFRVICIEPTFTNIRIMGAFGVILLIYSIFSWLSRGYRLLSPYLVFLLVLYVFCFGQPLLFAFDLLPIDDSLIGYLGITKADLYESEWLTLLMFAAFHLGALANVDKKKNNSIYIKNIDNKKVLSRLRKVGLLLFVISFYPYLQNTVNSLVYSLVYGYAALYDREMATGLAHATSFLSDLFIPSVICLYVGHKDNKLVRHILDILLLVNVAAIFLIGGRANGVIILALLVIMRDSLIKHFTKKEYVILISGAVVLLSLMSLLASTRNEGGRKLDADSFSSEENLTIKAIAEMGGSQSCLIKTMEYVPSPTEHFRYGKTYFFALTTIIPNLNFWDIHPAKKYANSGDWLTDKLGLSYGTGFSMTAEAYINFGIFGIIVFYILGYFFAKIFGSIDYAISNQDMSQVVFLLIILWFALKLPRSNFINIVRPFYFIALPIYLYCRSSVRKYNDKEQKRFKSLS